jgi:hypothetical protein
LMRAELDLTIESILRAAARAEEQHLVSAEQQTSREALDQATLHTIETTLQAVR